MRNRHGELHRAKENVHQANNTHSGPLTALVLGKSCLQIRIISLPDLRVCQGVGISAFTQVDLFFFSLVIIKKQNKTFCKPFGTFGKEVFPLLRTAESEKRGEQSGKPPLHGPVFPALGCTWAPQDAMREPEAIPG